MTIEPERINNGIQALRAFACIAVVLQHAIYFSFDACGNSSWEYWLRIAPGGIGVYIFFVISGYVITQSMRHGQKFILYRLFRIYPPYWGAVLISSSLLLIGRTWSFDSASFFLLPGPPLNELYRIPYWTLTYEMLFYLLMYFCVIMNFSKERTLHFFLGWIVLIVFFDIYKKTNINIPSPGILILFSPVNILFFFGVLVALARKGIWDAIPSEFLVLITIIGWCAARPFEPFDPSSLIKAPVLYYFFTGMSYAALLLFFQRLSVSGFISRIGDASYGIYLTHTVLILLVLAVLSRMNVNMPLELLLPATIILSLAFGFLYGIAEYRIYKSICRKYLR